MYSSGMSLRSLMWRFFLFLILILSLWMVLFDNPYLLFSENYKSKLWILVLFVGIVGVLVPTPLIEFRYYTIPMYLIALHCRMEQDHEDLESLLVALIYTAVNVSTMYLFLYRPFQWAHEPGVQRFMWWQLRFKLIMIQYKIHSFHARGVMKMSDD